MYLSGGRGFGLWGGWKEIEEKWDGWVLLSDSFRSFFCVEISYPHAFPFIAGVQAMSFLLLLGLVIIAQSTKPCFKAQVRKQPLYVLEKSNSRLHFSLLIREKQFSSRRELHFSLLIREKQFSSRRELLFSLMIGEKAILAATRITVFSVHQRKAVLAFSLE